MIVPCRVQVCGNKTHHDRNEKWYPSNLDAEVYPRQCRHQTNPCLRRRRTTNASSKQDSNPLAEKERKRKDEAWMKKKNRCPPRDLPLPSSAAKPSPPPPPTQPLFLGDPIGSRARAPPMNDQSAASRRLEHGHPRSRTRNCRLSMPRIPPSDRKRSVHERLDYFGLQLWLEFWSWWCSGPGLIHVCM